MFIRNYSNVTTNAAWLDCKFGTTKTSETFQGLFGTEDCKTEERKKTQEWEKNVWAKQRIGKT